MGQGIVIPIQAVVEISEGNLQRAEIFDVVRFLKRRTGALVKSKGITIPAKVYEVVHLPDECAANFTAQSGFLEKLDSLFKVSLRLCRLSYGIENLSPGPFGIGPGERCIHQFSDVQVRFREDLCQI